MKGAKPEKSELNTKPKRELNASKGLNKEDKGINKKFRPFTDSKIKLLEKQVEEKNHEVTSLLNQLKRLQAEFENYKKRIDKEEQSLRNYITIDLLKKFLPILDSFELALQDNKTTEESREGIKLIYAQLHSLFEGLNVRELKTIGRKFNPELHEALLVEESELPDGIIIEELQKGYTLNNTLLRTAKVKISKNNKEL